MKKQEWIAGRVAIMKELNFMQGLSEVQIGWIKDMFDSAWERGASEGRNEAYDNIQKLRKEDDETISS